MAENVEQDKPGTTFPGTVEKIIKPAHPSEPEKAQISIEGGEDPYREIRVENTLKGEDGKEYHLKEGMPVAVTIEAEKAAEERLKAVPAESDTR
jgi:hypothetical protein